MRSTPPPLTTLGVALFCHILSHFLKELSKKSLIMSFNLYRSLPSSESFFRLHWVFIAARGLSLVATSGGYSSLRCSGFSLRWLLLLRSTGSRRVGSVVVARGLSCSVACGIFLDQGSNLCPLPWQADS